MINTAKLRGKMAEHGYSQSALAKRMGISRASLNQKMNNAPKRYFTVREVEIGKDLLKIEDPAELTAIFFAPEVAEKQRPITAN
jgi:transcriptional regulator with XRE-family HTH domain